MKKIFGSNDKYQDLINSDLKYLFFFIGLGVSDNSEHPTVRSPAHIVLAKQKVVELAA